MLVVLEMDEAWSLMTVITSYVIDHGGMSQEGKQKVRRWRSDRAEGTAGMTELAAAMNQALGTTIEQQTDRTIRRKGRYVRSKERTS